VTRVDANALSLDWSQRGFSCDLWTDPPGQCWEGFVHDVDELFMPAEGILEIEIAGAVSRPGIGEELLIPAGAIHSVRNIGATTARWYYGYRSS
jgi:hypothetical protein